MSIARYNASGLDTTFSQDGRQLINDSGTAARGYDVLSHGSGALIAGYVVKDGKKRALVASVNENGTLDTSWGGDGLLIHGPPPGIQGNVELTSIARQASPEGPRIVVAGRVATAQNNFAFLARYTTAGQLDPSFGNAGRRIVPIFRAVPGAAPERADEVLINDVVVDTDPSRNRIIMVGSATYSGEPRAKEAIAVALPHNGRGLDTNWNGNGIQHLPFGNGDKSANGAVLQGGRLVVVGDRDGPGLGLEAVTERLKPDGTLDFAYGDGNGVTRWRGGEGKDGRDLSAGDVALDHQGHIVVAVHDRGGKMGSTENHTFTVIRYEGDGDADFIWGAPEVGNGLAEVRTDVCATIGYIERAEAMAIRSDGSVVVAGRATPCNSINKRQQFAVAIYRSA
jgi:uncharacterized delta-60 repeat protein